MIPNCTKWIPGGAKTTQMEANWHQKGLDAGNCHSIGSDESMGLESEDARISLASAIAAFGRPPRPVLCASHPPFTNERHAFSELNRVVRFKIKAIIFQQYAKYRQRNKQKSSHNRLTMQPNSIQNPEKWCPGAFRNGSWKKMVPEATWEQSGSPSSSKNSIRSDEI